VWLCEWSNERMEREGDDVRVQAGCGIRYGGSCKRIKWAFGDRCQHRKGRRKVWRVRLKIKLSII
jgi:hypothetical protein